MAKGKYQKWLEKDNLLRLEAWARDGLTNEQMSAKIGINPDTLYTWKNRFPEISDALKRGKEVVDIKVENALYKRALGYNYEEETKELICDELVTTKIVTKQIPPDVGAIAFWLKNRKSAQWRDKQPDESNQDAIKKLDDILSGINEGMKND